MCRNSDSIGREGKYEQGANGGKGKDVAYRLTPKEKTVGLSRCAEANGSEKALSSGQSSMFGMQQ